MPLFTTFVGLGSSKVYQAALGIVETQGYASHVYTNDEMDKTAGVSIFNVLTVHNRVVCSMIQGEVGAVRRLLLELNFVCPIILTSNVGRIAAASDEVLDLFAPAKLGAVDI